MAFWEATPHGKSLPCQVWWPLGLWKWRYSIPVVREQDFTSLLKSAITVFSKTHNMKGYTILNSVLVTSLEQEQTNKKEEKTLPVRPKTEWRWKEKKTRKATKNPFEL